MAWTDPVDADWQTDDIPTETQIKQQILDDLRHLRGQDGITSLEGDTNPLVDNSKDLGSALKRWAEIYGVNIYAGRYKVSPNIREVRITWPAGVNDNASVTAATGGGTTSGSAGTGQAYITVTDNVGGSERIDQRAAVAGTKGNNFVTTNFPYMRFEFNLDIANAFIKMFLGLRDTPTGALPTAGEHFAGIIWDTGAWSFLSGDGVNTEVSVPAPAVDARHIVEIYINNTTAVEFWLDGVLIATHTGRIPVGALKYTFLLISANGGAGATPAVTLGEVILKEALA